METCLGISIIMMDLAAGPPFNLDTRKTSFVSYDCFISNVDKRKNDFGNLKWIDR